jgi:N-acetyl-anhydromuramyl-L-alanine amidase AmpD
MIYPLVIAKHFSVGRGGHIPRMIVIHTMETPETFGRAHQVADWFAGATAPQVSAHYCVDNKFVYQTVRDADTAWAVDDFLINQESISIELAGAASQTVAQWHDAYSVSEFKALVGLCKFLMHEHGILASRLTIPQILDGKSTGFTTHADITLAKKIIDGHQDPGPKFNFGELLKAVHP